MLKRFVPLLVASLAALCVALGPGATRAFACNEYGVFWPMTDTAGNFITASGSWNTITLSNQTLRCVGNGGPAGMGQTSKMLIGGIDGDWVEAGWMMKLSSTGTKIQRSFFEAGWDFTGFQQTLGTYSCLNPGTRHDFKVEYDSTVDEWFGFLRCYADPANSWINLDEQGMLETTYGTGYAEGEGFTRGTQAGLAYESTMGETHSNMQYRDASGVWQTPTGSAYPAGLKCRRDDDGPGNWNGSWLSANSFQIVSSGGQTC